MKITVITVSFNAAHTIAHTLESVAMQNHPDVEHIVIDGASTDGTPEIVKQKSQRVAKFLSEPDRGIYDAMNKGLALANGKVICFLNADDVYASSDVLAHVAHEIEQHGLDALMGDVAFFHPGKPDRIVRRYRSDRFRPDRLAYGWMPAHPALFLGRDVIDRVGHFRTDYRIAGDFEFIVRVFTKINLRYRHLPEVLVKMQTGGVSDAGLCVKFLLNREMLRACKENGVKTNILKILSKYPEKLLELFLR